MVRATLLVIGALWLGSACGSSSKPAGMVDGSGGPAAADAAGGAGGGVTDGAPRAADATVAEVGVGGEAGVEAGGASAAAPDGGGTLGGHAIVYRECPAGTVSAQATAIAAVPAGLVAVVEPPGGAPALERYTGQGCSLTRDAAFSAARPPRAGTQIAADSRGHLYFGAMGQSNETVELDALGAVVQRYTQAALRVGVAADGLSLMTAFIGSPLRSLRPSVADRFMVDPTFAVPAINLVGGVVVRGPAGALVGGRLELGMPHHVFAIDPTGHVTATYGNPSPAAADGLCSVAALAACGQGSLCVADSECRKLLVFGATGAYRDGFQFPDSRRPLSLASLPSGDIYLLRGPPAPGGPTVLGIVTSIP
jgi:hypothetical protein